MKKFFLFLILISCNAFLLPYSHAAWYEVTGTATITSSEEIARINAIEDALYKALQFSGADIGTLPLLRPYIEHEKKEYYFTNHEVRSIEVKKEKIHKGRLLVELAVDIYPTANACHTNQYKKTLMLSNFDILSNKQAAMGRIYKIGDHFTHLLERQFEQESPTFVSAGVSDFIITSDDPNRLKMIAQDNGAQYIMSGNITDLSTTVETFRIKDDVTHRQFALELQVYDGKTGQEIYTQIYREVALWPFSRTSEIDTKSARFWTSEYGEMLTRISRNIMLDMESEFSCKITLPTIVSKWNNTITIDLGRIHGVQTGDRLQLWHTGSFLDQNGLSRNKVIQSDITLTVGRVYEQEAEVIVEQQELRHSIQIGDVMHRIQ